MSQKGAGIFQRRRDWERKQSTRAAANLQPPDTLQTPPTSAAPRRLPRRLHNARKVAALTQSTQRCVIFLTR